MKIELGSAFKKSYKKIASKRPELAIITLEKILLFSIDPHSPSLRFHKLKGKLEGIWSFSIENDLRILVDMTKDDTALLVMIGTYDEVY
ncbi:MAG: type II toxin-antitoxin system mRNA interferase toxin, RelE/StbE family [Chitinophagaceae bacterium]|nr:type II toxin-antitoxin system mRNA interferase toxin, RelE/StbE family [Chitinophagaceae bacterium]